MYDKYNDNYIYVPAASTTAGILAATDANFGPWYSPAGERRGEYVGVTNLAYSPNKAERDESVQEGCKPNRSVSRSRHPVCWATRLRLARPSAFDRINVRRLFLALEKAVASRCTKLPVRIQRRVYSLRICSDRRTTASGSASTTWYSGLLRPV